MKKLLAFLMVFIIIFLSSCSKESKFGVQQFVERMNKQFDTEYNTNDFLLGKKGNENILLMTNSNQMITLSLDKDNNIKGIGILLTAEGNIENAKITYCRMCSVFTNKDYKEHTEIFDNCDFLSDDINFVDGNSIITVDRFKYTIVSNNYSITMFCDKI